MTGQETYFNYLRGRGYIGLLYRRCYLYPRLVRHVPGRVLDVGCGIGDFLRFNSGAIGVDVNPYAVQWCREQGLEAWLMEADRLPFDNASFQGVVLDNVLEHLSEPRPLLGEIHRVLAPGGRLLVGVPGRRGYERDPDHKIFYDENNLVGLLSEVGFPVRKLIYTPWRSKWLDIRLSQYCLYGVFERLPAGD